MKQTENIISEQMITGEDIISEQMTWEDRFNHDHHQDQQKGNMRNIGKDNMKDNENKEENIGRQ